MNTSIYGLALAALPLFAVAAQAADSPVGRYTTPSKAQVTITQLASGDHVGRVAVPGGAEYSLRQAKSLNAAEQGYEWIFVIQPSKKAPGAQTFNVFRRNPAGVRGEAIRLLCLSSPNPKGQLQGKVVARTMVKGPTRSAIPFTPFVWNVNPAQASESLVRHTLVLSKFSEGLPLPGSGAEGNRRAQPLAGRLLERDGQLVLERQGKLTVLESSQHLARALRPLEGNLVEVVGEREGSALRVTKVVSPRVARLRGRVSRRDGRITLGTAKGEVELAGGLASMLEDGQETSVRGWHVTHSSPVSLERRSFMVVTSFVDTTTAPITLRTQDAERVLPKGARVWVTGTKGDLTTVRRGKAHGSVARSDLNSSAARGGAVGALTR